ncbi:MAG TPA: MlaD family protein [Vicinamibacterales bacterium]|jgi:phospholipid/cholesterol/gamma-HCH transport system substrate-binding protein
MPRTRSLAYSELKIGILAVVALSIAAVVIFMLSGTGGFFWERYSLKTRFRAVPGLKAGAPVRVAGVEVGTVRDIAFVGSDVEVTFQVSRKMQPRITSQSIASLGSLSLLGQSTVDITPSLGGEPVAEWGYVKSGRMAGQLADVTEIASQGLEQATRLMQDLRAGKGTLGRLFTDDALYRDLQGFIGAAAGVAENLRRGRGTAGRLLTDPAAYESLEASLRNLNAMLDRINDGQGSLGRLLQDDRLAVTLTSATGNLDTLTGKLNKGVGTAGKLLNDSALYDRLSSTAERLEQLTGQLNQGQGTAGQLLHDRQLYENMNGAAGELRGLVADIRKEPRKYLSFKVSVF